PYLTIRHLLSFPTRRSSDLISGIDDPFTELERLASVCPPDVQVALIGENREITFYRELMELGLTEYLPKPLTRDIVLDQLRPKLDRKSTRLNSSHRTISYAV